MGIVGHIISDLSITVHEHRLGIRMIAVTVLLVAEIVH